MDRGVNSIPQNNNNQIKNEASPTLSNQVRNFIIMKGRIKYWVGMFLVLTTIVIGGVLIGAGFAYGSLPKPPERDLDPTEIEIESLISQLEEIQQKILEITEERDSLASLKDDMEAEISSLENEFAQLKEDNESLITSSNASLLLISELEKELIQLKKHLEEISNSEARITDEIVDKDCRFYAKSGYEVAVYEVPKLSSEHDVAKLPNNSYVIADTQLEQFNEGDIAWWKISFSNNNIQKYQGEPNFPDEGYVPKHRVSVVEGHEIACSNLKISNLIEN